MIRIDLKQSIRYGMLLCALWLTAVASFGFVTCVSNDGNTAIHARHHILTQSQCSSARQPQQTTLFSLEHVHHSCQHECEHIAITCIVGQPVKFSACSCKYHVHACRIHTTSSPMLFKPALQIFHPPHYRIDPLLHQLSATVLRI